MLLVTGCGLFNGAPESDANASPHIASLTPSETSLAPGGLCTVTCTASDPDGDALTYTWTASGGVIAGSGSTIIWEAPQDEGSYTISVTVSDGKGGTAGDSYTFEIAGNFGVIEVESSPTGAVVYLDGEDTGNTTPCTITGLEPGSYTVKLTLQHHEYREQVVTVAAKETTHINWTLTYADVKTLTLQPVGTDGKDAFVSDLYPDFNFASHSNIIVGSRETGTYRGYLQFDLPTIPDGAVVETARLGLLYFDNKPEVAGNIGVYAVEESWNENDISWDNQPSCSSTPDNISNVPSSAGLSFVYWDISDLVQSWLDGSVPNYGMMLKNPEENNWQAWKYFRSSNYYSEYSPMLIIDYYTP
jgi:hypothetical protein